MSLSRNFVYTFVKCIILLQIQYENFFLPTSQHRQGKVRCFLQFVCTTALFIAQISSSENVSRQDAIWAPVAKQ